MYKLKRYITAFIESKTDTPLIAGLIVGLTPLLFYYSNNYWQANSWEHLLFFSLTVVGSFCGVFVLLYFIFNKVEKLRPYTKHILFWLTLLSVVVFLSHIFFFSIKRKIALLALLAVLAFILPFRPRQHYKKLLVMLSVFSLISLAKVVVHIYEDLKPDSWMAQPDDILTVNFTKHPNVYFIQPEGYVSEQTLTTAPYDFKSDLYDWLVTNGFKVYEDFRSNYPASLSSNASLFTMKHHNFGNMLFPGIEMANAREAITVKNPVSTVFQNNGYKTYFIAQDEYFQQNRKQKSFDYFNIQKDDFPFYTRGDSEIRIVFEDLKHAMSLHNDVPKFFFIEKLLPHHVAFYGTEASIATERQRYFENVTEVNDWLKTTINYISKEDKNSIIIVLADHGGWVGLRSFNDLFSNTDPKLIRSIYSSIAAIKWNGNLTAHSDKNLKTSVNLFRILFSVLSDDTKYLDYLEDDSSYNLKLNTLGFKQLIQCIDGNGNIINVK